MTPTWPKVILDPIHELIPFEDNACDRLLLDLINTREFQRLRRIKQLGMSELVFPGSNHSRFAHSIGVMHVARMILNRLQEVLDETFVEDVRMAVCAAALLHDIGHGPFSHAFEKVTGLRHEQRTIEIIRGDTEVNAALRKQDAMLPDRVAMFIEPTGEAAWRAAGLPPYFGRIVSSQLDGDRLDYLLRDSLAAGTTYGKYDLRWLLLHLRVDSERRLIYLGRKALSAVETYVFARHHMYKSVYFHKTTRAAEVMLRLAFGRYKALLCDAPTQPAREAIVPDAPRLVVAAFTSDMNLHAYLGLDDYVVTEFLKQCEKAHDPSLRAIGSGVVHRRLFKAVDATGTDSHVLASFIDRARHVATERGYDPEYFVVHDRAADIAYKPYNPIAQEEITQIFIEDEKGVLSELSQQSEAVKTLTEKTSLLRYYFPEELRADLAALYFEMIHREK